jgi:hypothetical protein
MKNMILFTAFVFLLLNYSCIKECDGYGKLKVTNDSNSTVQKILIDGTSYATLSPGESETIELAEGEYYLEFVGMNGGGGCSPSIVHIVECETEGRTCRY